MKLINLTKRNIKVYFSDKGMFFTSLITPLILLVLYTTFLGNVYHDSFLSMIPDGIEVSKKLINGLVSSQLISSLLAVSCITVAFCSNMLMVQDKVNGSIKDIEITPTNKKLLSVSYFLASFISTLIVNFFALIICLIYLSSTGWFLTLTDVFLIILNVIILTLFGCTLSSIINSFLNSQGQISAVGTIVSSMYGFICGAYMPMSQFGEGLRNALLFLPGTYGTAMIKNTIINAPFRELSKIIPVESINTMKEGIDARIIFFDHVVSVPTMYIIMIASITVLLTFYIIKSSLKTEK